MYLYMRIYIGTKLFLTTLLMCWCSVKIGIVGIIKICTIKHKVPKLKLW